MPVFDKRPQSVALFDDSPIKYRSNIKSGAVNSILDGLKKTVIRSILRTQRINERLDAVNQAIVLENIYLTSKVKELSQLNTIADGTDRVSIITMHNIFSSPASGVSADAHVPQSLEFDTLYGQVSMKPIKSFSKIATFDNEFGDKRPVPEIEIKYDGATLDRSDTIYNIVDGNNFTVWTKDLDGTSGSGSTTDPDAEHTVEIKLPISLTPLVNQLTINPFPSFSTEITKVEYLTRRGQFQDIFQSIITGGSDVGISHGGLIKIHFRPIDYAEVIRLTLKATKPGTGIDGKTVIGLSDVDVKFNDYNNNTAIIYYDFPGTANYNISEITDFGINFYADLRNLSLKDYGSEAPLQAWITDDLDEVFELTPDILTGETKIVWNSSVFNKKQLKLKLRLQESNLTSPVVRSAFIRFKT